MIIVSNFRCSPDREDIVQYIKERGQVSVEEIFQKFGIGRDTESFHLELNGMIHKSKLALTNTGGEYYIDFDGRMFIYKSK